MAVQIAMKPSDTRARIADLNKELSSMAQQIESAQNRSREIEREIRQLQEQCQHGETVSRPFHDGPDVKYYDVCVHCNHIGKRSA